MTNADTREYLPLEDYKHWEEALGLFIPLVLSSLAAIPQDAKITVIRNFIARARVSLQGVFQLWAIEDYQDCWVLHRCMLDRLFHLNDLLTSDAFEAFDDWSFLQLYNARNRVRSDARFKSKISQPFFRDNRENKQRYQALVRNKPKWERPFAEDVAKRMKLDFLYKYGFDFASTLVHPMSNDGEFDFVLLTGMGDKAEYPNQFVVIHNSCLVAFLILQEGLIQSGCLWRGIVNTCLDDFLKFLETGSDAYKSSLPKIIELGPHVNLCKIKGGG